MSGVREKPKAPQNPDDALEKLYAKLPTDKMLTRELWQETVDPLLPVEGIAESDMEFFQFHEGKRRAAAEVVPDHFANDTMTFQNARKNAALPQLEIKPGRRKLQDKEDRMKAGLERMKARIKIVKRKRSRSPRQTS